MSSNAHPSSTRGPPTSSLGAPFRPSSHPITIQDKADIQNISPIMFQNKNYLANSDFYQAHPQNNLDESDQFQDSDQFCFELDTPETQVKNTYGREMKNSNQREEDNLKFNKAKLAQYEDEEQEFVTAKKETMNPNMLKPNKLSDSGTCAEFDLIAKEISTNKRSERMRSKPQQIGRPSDSPALEEQKSGSEMTKWAVSKDSQVETQKKFHQNNNAQGLIQRTLKSHDSNTSNTQQHLTSQSSNNPVQIKGKILDFGNSDSSKKQQFGFLQGNSLDKRLFLATEDSNLQKQQLQSFLDNEFEDMNVLGNIGKQINQGYRQQNGITSKVRGIKFQSSKLSEALQDMVENKIDCQLCFEQRMYHSSIDCTQLEGPKSGKQIIEENLNKKYLTSREYYNVKIINDIIYNENTHIVSVFKDYLIFDDVSEFLKRHYNRSESLQRLPRMFEFYEKYSKVFANYVILPENKYMFKNIERKQRLQDEKQRIVMEQQQMKANGGLNHSAERQRNKHKDRFSEREHNSSSISQLSNNRMFNTNFIDSVNNIKPSGFIELSVTNSNINMSLYQEHVMNSSTLLIQKHLQDNMDKAKQLKKEKRKGKGALEDLDFDELISKFIAKDTESNIHESLLKSDKVDQKHVQKVKEVNQGGKKVNPSGEKKIENALEVKQGKKQIYEYQEQQLNGGKPNEGRPISALQQQKVFDGKRLSTGSMHAQDKGLQNTQDELSSIQKQSKPASTHPSKREKTPQEMQAQTIEEGKILNYNIYNNFNQFINNENYYISTDKDAPPSNELETSPQLEQAIIPQVKSGSLSRAQSRSNLHLNSANSANQNKATLLKVQQQNVVTPSKIQQIKEQKTPTSGSVGRKGQVQKNLKKRYVKEQEQNEILMRQAEANGVEVSQQNQCISINDNKSISSMQRLSNDPNMSPRVFMQNKQIANGINSAKISQQVNSNAVAQGELSKERMQKPNLNVKSSNQNQQLPLNAQMFKNDTQVAKSQQLLQRDSIQQRFYNMQAPEADYTKSSQVPSNVRSVEKMKLIEEEIEKDYSKYQNEYGLTKTAFAKAINVLREKSQQRQQDQQQIQETMRSQNSNEKGRRATSNNARGQSNSQSRKQQIGQGKLVNQENVNELYMNTARQDQSKNIRSIRTKTINSQNSSSCFQKSQKMSPDKNLFLQNPNINSLQNVLIFNQSEIGLNPQQKTSNYITLKAQPGQQKGIKIKVPSNQTTSRGNSSSKNIFQKANNNNNTSQTQTPKRVKLQKTKSSSNIHLGKLGSTQNQNLCTQRGRISELGILDQISQQYNLNPSMSTTSKDLMSQMSHLGFNQLQLNQMNDFNMQSIDTAQPPSNPYLMNYPFNSCVGTYATTSILNSPLSFKHQSSANRNGSKGPNGRASSRNGNQSSHQSQKSITNHQRVGSNTNPNTVLSSNNKVKPNKRMSAGSNQSSSQRQQNILQSQMQSNPLIMQLVLQSFQNGQHPQDSDLGSTTMASGIGGLQNTTSQAPLSTTLKSIQQQSHFGQQSMKNLKSVKQSTNHMMKEMQMIKPSKIKTNNPILLQQSTSNLNALQTQRTGSQQPTILNQVLKSKIQSKSGKNTQRGESKKRASQLGFQGTQPMNDTRMTSGLSHMDASIANQDQKRIMGYSKSQESLDLIKMVAQKAAHDQMQMMQQRQQYQPQVDSSQTLSHQASSSSLHPSKQSIPSANDSSAFYKLMQKHPQSNGQPHQITIPHQNTNHHQPPPTLQSVRNLNFQIQSGPSTGSMNQHQQFQFKGEYEGIGMNNVKTPTTMILPQGNDKSQSRRTSGKFNPSSAKNN